MFMHRNFPRRSTRLITTLVVISLIFAPSLSQASCCCVIAKLGQAVGLDNTGCCEQVDRSTCCAPPVTCAPEATSERASLPPCCRAGISPEVLQTVSGCGANVSSDLKSPNGSKSCQCERSCCDNIQERIEAISGEREDLRLLQDIPAEASVLFVAYQSIPSNFAVQIGSEPRFLSVPHRCATLCRWLN
jgi:hypothetical protein